MATRPIPSWPTAQSVGDPFDDLPAVELDSRHGDHLSCGGELAEPEYAATVQQYLDVFQAIMAGSAQLADLTDLSEVLAVADAPRAETRAPWGPGRPATAVTLARIATDFSPAGGLDAPDQVLGPWADVITAQDSHQRLALRYALAIYAVARVEVPMPSTADRWRARKPLPSIDARSRVIQAQRAPQAVWQIDDVDGDYWHLSDLTGLHTRYQPVGPVHVPDWGAVTPVEPGAAATLTARLVDTGAGWQAVAPLLVPGRVPTAVVRAWVQLLTARARLVGRRDRLEPLLAQRGHELARRLHCWAWSRT
jgi:hypothetical protein